MAPRFSANHRRLTTDRLLDKCISPECFLSDHSYCCELDDGAIILELATGTYVGIHAECLPDLQGCIRNWPNSRGTNGCATRTMTKASENLIAALLARGILTTSPTPQRLSTIALPVAALTIPGSAATWRWASIMFIPKFVIALLTVVRRHSDKNLVVLLDWIRKRQSAIGFGGHAATLEDAGKLLASFFRFRVWFYTANRRCLFDSLILSVFLTKHLIPCTFVIGVSTKPFLAHSWVQIGEFVLNDTTEHVQTFAPILSIGPSS
jgi:hypothetical protein